MSREYQILESFINETTDLENGFQADRAFITFTSVTPATANNWFYDARSQGWFRDQFSSINYNPFAVMVFDGDDPDDRVLLIGSDDGYVREIDEDSATDDGTAIESYAIIGPISSGDSGYPIILTELQAITDETSHVIKYEVLAGDTPEAAIDSEEAVFAGDGTLAASMGATANPRVRGYYLYVKVGTTDATTAWAIEKLRAKIAAVQTGRGRSRDAETISYPIA